MTRRKPTERFGLLLDLIWTSSLGKYCVQSLLVVQFSQFLRISSVGSHVGVLATFLLFFSVYSIPKEKLLRLATQLRFASSEAVYCRQLLFPFEVFFWQHVIYARATAAARYITQRLDCFTDIALQGEHSFLHNGLEIIAAT